MSHHFFNQLGGLEISLFLSVIVDNNIIIIIMENDFSIMIRQIDIVSILNFMAIIYHQSTNRYIVSNQVFVKHWSTHFSSLWWIYHQSLKFCNIQTRFTLTHTQSNLWRLIDENTVRFFFLTSIHFRWTNNENSSLCFVFPYHQIGGSLQEKKNDFLFFHSYRRLRHTTYQPKKKVVCPFHSFLCHPHFIRPTFFGRFIHSFIRSLLKRKPRKQSENQKQPITPNESFVCVCV